jgi:hypothetical protein
MYPLYEIERGKQRGTVKEFIFVPESEYNALIAELGPKDGLRKAKRLEYDRIRSRRISTNPEERAHWSARRAQRRATNVSLRERERRLDRISAKKRCLQRKMTRQTDQKPHHS